MLLEKGSSIILGNMQGLKIVLDNNEQVRDAFKLMILKRFNGLGYMTPEAKYLSGIAMAMVGVYTINQMKEKQQTQQQPGIIPQQQSQQSNDPVNNESLNVTDGLPPHIVESMNRQKEKLKDKYKDL